MRNGGIDNWNNANYTNVTTKSSKHLNPGLSDMRALIFSHQLLPQIANDSIHSFDKYLIIPEHTGPCTSCRTF